MPSLSITNCVNSEYKHFLQRWDVGDEGWGGGGRRARGGGGEGLKTDEAGDEEHV